ncbi:hypothetical protein [Vibrio campbellii]|uniref:hypothetical protein n=1 Tax=Vibrio campbellii TaxID=680 RepID=UPI000A6AF40A|nr:hypothetical protein [Vibrio campbellii]
MEKCPAIVGVVFDDKSLAAIDRINELHELEKSAQFFISLGNLINIFGQNVVKGAGSSGATKAISAIPASDIMHKARDVSIAVGRGVSSNAGQKTKQTGSITSNPTALLPLLSLDKLKTLLRNKP